MREASFFILRRTRFSDMNFLVANLLSILTRYQYLGKQKKSEEKKRDFQGANPLEIRRPDTKVSVINLR